MDHPDNEPGLTLRVVWHDMDIIEIETRVRFGKWSAVASTYASPDFLSQSAWAILDWAKSPQGTLRLDTGPECGNGRLALEFYPFNRAGGVRCRVTLATNHHPANDSVDGIWRMSIEMAPELGRVERFGRECMALGESLTGDARLRIA